MENGSNTILELHRPNAFVWATSIFRVSLDGKKIGTLARGETKCFEIEPGSHSLEIRESSAGMRAIFPYKFDVQSGSKKSLQMCANGTAFLYGFMPWLLFFTKPFEIREN